jgi:hypothetical protein
MQSPMQPLFSSKPPLQPNEIFKIGYYAGKGMAQSQIAKILERDPSTISRTIHKFLPEDEIPPIPSRPSILPFEPMLYPPLL